MPALRSNTAPAGRALHVRTVVRRRDDLAGPTVTVGALCDLGSLSAHLRASGDDPERLGAEIPMANPVCVGPTTLRQRRRRALSAAARIGSGRGRSPRTAPAPPAGVASGDGPARRVLRRDPAALLRWGMGQFDRRSAHRRSPANTVVSSVNRGRADLTSWRVLAHRRLSALSPMMALTHGVHGIGDTVAISVHAAESAIGDIDAYTERLVHELG